MIVFYFAMGPKQFIIIITTTNVSCMMGNKECLMNDVIMRVLCSQHVGVNDCQLRRVEVDDSSQTDRVSKNRVLYRRVETQS